MSSSLAFDSDSLCFPTRNCIRSLHDKRSLNEQVPQKTIFVLLAVDLTTILSGGVARGAPLLPFVVVIEVLVLLCKEEPSILLFSLLLPSAAEMEEMLRDLMLKVPPLKDGRTGEVMVSCGTNKMNCKDDTKNIATIISR